MLTTLEIEAAAGSRCPSYLIPQMPVVGLWGNGMSMPTCVLAARGWRFEAPFCAGGKYHFYPEQEANGWRQWRQVELELAEAAGVSLEAFRRLPLREQREAVQKKMILRTQ